MSKNKIQKCIRTATSSLEMEGFNVEEQSKKLCEKLLKNEITLKQYIDFAKSKAGVLQ